METLKNNIKITDWFSNIRKPLIISGPCSAETEDQVLKTCERLSLTGKVDILRAGIWKPRTRPNNFEGIGSQGLKWLHKAKIKTGLPITTEVASAYHVQEALKYGIDILWIGARTTVNPFSIQEIADSLKGVNIPVLVKNPINTDLELWIGALERIQQAGITQIGAIHRGFHKYGEKKFRNTPQWQIPIELRRRFPDIPLICDPSHICGNRHMLKDISQKALDLNYDGLMIESHIDPDNAWSDAKQQIVPERVAEIVNELVIRSTKPDKEDITELTAFRQQIDIIDQEIFNILAQRMSIVEQIGEYKKKNNIAILQSKRWDNILNTAYKTAENLNLNASFVEKYLKAVHQESIDRQNSVMND